AQTEKILLGLGFKHSDFTRLITEVSSGWQMRVELAKILLRNPEVMLLDEPTNHLDIESIEWLELFLQSYQGSVILVSHDRKFLDNVTNRTIEIVLGKIEDYKVSYSEYLIQRAERREVQQNAYDNQQKEIEDIERFIERFRYKATKAKQAQSRLKTLNKMDRIEVDELDKSAISFRFPPAPHSGKVVVNTHNLSKYYGPKHIFSNVDICIERGEKVALVGKNGEGKSTFSKIVVGEIRDAQGECTLGHQVKIGYFAQNQAALLDGNKTVFETLDDIAVGEIRPRVRNILGCFLFSGPDIDKKVKVLSGGEKTRLALAKLLLSPVNLLILDEPTNHLDLISKDILKSALLQYDGSLIIVSHDRDFLEGLTQKVYEFKDTKVKMHIGDVSEFLATRKIEQLNDLNRAKAKEKKESKTENIPLPPQKESEINLTREEKKNKEREERKRKNQIEKVEDEIARLEKELEEMTQQFAEPNFSDLKMYDIYYEKKALLDKKMEEWEAALK
ncbi:MAG: ABC-F family ATP-binding cassette domain-containing protein, partial [Bacteroidales bacterium]